MQFDYELSDKLKGIVQKPKHTFCIQPQKYLDITFLYVFVYTYNR